MKIVVLPILFFLFALSTKAQNENNAGGTITGRVIDSISGKSIEFATIGLFTIEGNKVVNGTMANDKGVFTMNNVAEGNYKIVIDFIGYKRIEKNNIVLNKEKLSLDLGDIKLSDKNNKLKEVVVTTDHSLIENKIDKLVYNVDKDITSQGGVAADVLKKVPEVSVDVDGNVELQGNSNVRFLINGKPSLMFGSNIADVLQTIPASQIQSIEVITSPGAKYDAEGTGGIINIILKKNTAQGVSGNVSLTGGTRLENGSLNLNARKGKFGMYAFLSGNAQLQSTVVNSMDRLSNDTSTTARLLQNGTSAYTRGGYQSGLGFDWDITPKDNLSGTVSYDYYGVSSDGSTSRQSILQDAAGNPLSTINDAVNTTSNYTWKSLDYNLGYKKKFKKEDQELEISFISSTSTNYSDYEQTQKYVSPDLVYNSSNAHNPGDQKETTIALNYAQPLAENVLIETGAKATLDKINSTSDVYLLNTSTGSYDYNADQSFVMNHQRNVYAGYLSTTFKVLKFIDVKAGARYEYTEAQAYFSNSGNETIAPYNTLVPSLVMSHTFKDHQTLKISYTHRIERPDYRDLNPFVNASDPKNVSSGNPGLRPEIGDKIELGYNKVFSKGATLTSTLFYRGNMDDIQSYTRYYPTYKIGDSTYNNVAVTTRENIGREDNFGLSIFGSIPVTEKISLRSNISCFERYITTGISSVGDVHGFNYRINLNASYQLSNTLIIEAFGNFNSRRINAQGTMPSFTTYNLAFRKQLFHKNGSIALTATNPFNKYIDQKTNLTGDNFTIVNIRQLPYQSFGINFTYKFGKLEFKKEKEGDTTNDNPPGME